MATYVNFLRNGLVYIPGESKGQGHEGWIEALSLQLRPPPQHSHSDSDQESPSTGGAMIILKAADSASPRIAMAAHDATDMTVVFDLVKSSNNNENLRYSATGATITQVSLSPNGSGGTETVTISFGKVVIGDNPDGPDVSNHIAPEIGYDLPQPTPI